MLREKGALALRDMLSVTRPFVEVLFQREVELEPLDTPEKKAGLKKRLRALAAQIEDKDLAESYRHDLLERYDALIAPQRQAPQQGAYPPNTGPRGNRPAWRGKIEPHLQPAMQESRAAAQNLSRALDPLCAGLAQGLIDHPDWLFDAAENLEAYGFGDEALEPLARGLVSLSFQHETLDSDSLARHLHRTGLGALLSEIQKAALKSGAPFLAPDTTLADAHARWRQAFNAVARLTALDRELNSSRDKVGTELFSRFKLERDALRRSLRSGQFWQDETTGS